MPPDLSLYCQAVLDAMKITSQTQVFGPASDPLAEVTTPTFVAAGEGLDPAFWSFGCANTGVL